MFYLFLFTFKITKILKTTFVAHSIVLLARKNRGSLQFQPHTEPSNPDFIAFLPWLRHAHGSTLFRLAFSVHPKWPCWP